jgi:signal peptidase I
MFGSILKKIGQFFLDIIEVAVIAMAIFVIVYLFLFQPHQVRGSSMYPSFKDNEYILTDKISYRFDAPQRGEVIIFKAPGNEEYEYIKRVIALPGEQVRIQEGHVYINDQVLDESDYLASDTYTQGGRSLPIGDTGEVLPDHYFVLGDNRSHSSDSRDWGLVPTKNIIGKAWFRYWPPEEFGKITEENYQLNFAQPN